MSHLYNVWDNSQFGKTTIMADSELGAKQTFALRYGYLRDMAGYAAFINNLNAELVY